MIVRKQSSAKVIILSLVFLSAILFFHTAKAGFVGDSIANGVSSISKIVDFVNKKIIGQIKNDFCHNYIISISNGDWKEGEFRSNLGKKFCSSYSTTVNSTGKLDVEALNGNAKISNTESVSSTSINNPKPDVYVPTSNVGSSINTNEVYNLTNVERKNIDQNLVNLKYNNTLAKIAAVRIQDMFALQYFEHNSPTGDNASKEAAKNGYEYITIGENIALGNFDGAQGLVTAWMNSPGHRANILNKNYTEIGVAAASGMYKGQTVWIAAQIFGKPITGCVAPDLTLKNNVIKYKASAETMLANINKIDTELKAIGSGNTSEYNAKIAERNTLAGLYNNLASEIKSSVVQYNQQVSEYNICVKTI
jgi:uncharacterized protein YkwD